MVEKEKGVFKKGVRLSETFFSWPVAVFVPVIAAKICFEFVGRGCFVFAYWQAVEQTHVWDFHTQGLHFCMGWGDSLL